MNQKGSILPIVLFFLVIILLALIYNLGFQKGLTSIISQTNSNHVSSIVSITLPPLKCKSNGIDSKKDDLYTKYIVKSGDTLLSISSQQLSSNSRLGDIIYINNDTYPGLSIEQPYIEPGWILYLPPSYIPSIQLSGQTPELPYLANGELINIASDNTWTIKLNNLNPKYTFTSDSSTKFIQRLKTDYKPGDCLSAVIQGIGLKVYQISPQ